MFTKTTEMSLERALFIRFGGLGDILLATPMVRALADSCPGIEIDFIVDKNMEEALTGNPYIRNVIAFDKRGPDMEPRHLLPFLARLARARYDVVFNLNPSAKSFLMSAAAGTGCNITFCKRMGVRKDSGRVTHAIDDFAKELRSLGFSKLRNRHMDFVTPETARQRVALFMNEAGITDKDRLLVINPFASRPLNRWPLGRFRAVAAHFAARSGIKVVVTGASWEMAGVQEVTSDDSRIISVAGLITVKELGALLLRANTLLTCDTGPMHIAAALQTPMVVLSGAADPDRTGPITAGATVLIDRTLPCVPCRQRTCGRGDVMCMQNLSVSAVIAAVEERLLAAP